MGTFLPPGRHTGAPVLHERRGFSKAPICVHRIGCHASATIIGDNEATARFVHIHVTGTLSS